MIYVQQVECQKLCAYLVEIETQEESEWLAATFIMKGKPPSCYLVVIVSESNLLSLIVKPKPWSWCFEGSKSTLKKPRYELSMTFLSFPFSILRERPSK